MPSSSFTQLPGNVLQNLYVNGCSPSYTTTTTVTIGTGQVRDSTNSFDIAVKTPLVINMAAKGANGLDTGTFAASTSYYLYVLYDETQANPPVALASLSATAPVMPSLNGVTYSHFRLVGFIRSNGSTNILPFLISGNGATKFYAWDAPIVVLTAAAGTTPTNVSLVTAMPLANFGRVELQSTYVPHAAGETASIKPSSATAFTYVISGIVASVAQTDLFEVIPTLVSSNPSIAYQLSVGTAPAALTLAVTGFNLLL